MSMATTAAFADAFRALCDEHDLTVSRAATLISASVHDVSASAIHKSLAGERPVSLHLMEATARFFDVDPSVFAEYELEVVRRNLDPRVVGLESALEELRRLKDGG